MTAPRPSRFQSSPDTGNPDPPVDSGLVLRLPQPQPEPNPAADEALPSSGVHQRPPHQPLIVSPPPRRFKRTARWLLALCLLLVGLAVPSTIERLETFGRQLLTAQLAKSGVRVEWTELEWRASGVYLEYVLLRPTHAEPSWHIQADQLRLRIHWLRSLLERQLVVSSSHVKQVHVRWHHPHPSAEHQAPVGPRLRPRVPALDELLGTLWRSSLRSARVDSLAVHISHAQSPPIEIDMSALALLRTASRELQLRANIDRARRAGEPLGAGRISGVLTGRRLHLQDVTWQSEFGRLSGHARIDLNANAAPVEASGAIHALPSRLPALLNQHLPDGLSLTRVDQPAVVEFRGRGPALDPSAWSLVGNARLSSLGLRAPSRTELAPALDIERANVRFEYAAGVTRFDVSARAPGASLTGSGRHAGADLDFSLHLRLRDTQWLEPLGVPARLLPYVAVGSPKPLDLTIDASARRQDERWRARGRLNVAQLQIQTAAYTGRIDSLNVTWDYHAGGPLQIAALSLQSPAARLSGDGWISATGYSLRLRAEAVDLPALADSAPGTLRSGTASGTFTVRGDFAGSAREAQGHVKLTGLAWLPARGQWPELSLAELDTVHADVDWRHGKLSFANVRGHGRAQTAQGTARGDWTGWLSLEAKRLHWGLQFERLEAPLLGLVLPGVWKGGPLRLSLRGSGTEQAPLKRLDGRAEWQRVSWRATTLPAELRTLLGASPVTFHSGSASFDYSAQGWRIERLKLNTNLGRLQASAYGTKEQHRVEVDLESTSTRRLGQLLPGRLHSGRWRLQGTLRGNPRAPLETFTGRAWVSDARWSAPAQAPWCAHTFDLAHGASHFSWDGRQLHLTDIRLDSNSLRLQGELLHDSDSTFLDVQLATRRAGEVLSLLPELRDLLGGGSGLARVRLRATQEGTAGEVEGHIGGGTLTVASFDPTRRETHPVDSAHFQYDFGPDWRRLKSLALRGPEVNVDLDVGWFDTGTLYGAGQAWLTRAYTQRLAKGAGWLLDILGYRRLASRFQLSGSPRFIRLQADIVRDWQWQVLTIAMPKHVAKVARGDKPLLSSSPTSKSAATCR